MPQEGAKALEIQSQKSLVCPEMREKLIGQAQLSEALEHGVAVGCGQDGSADGLQKEAAHVGSTAPLG